MSTSLRIPSLAAVLRMPWRTRAVGWVSVVACAALLAGFVVLGGGAAGARVSISDLGAWLSSSKAHSVVHVNGSTGQVDGRVDIPGDGEGLLQVGVDGETVLVLDEQTGVVSRIDTAQLTVPQSRAYASKGMSLEVGAGRAWLVDPAGGTVQPIDPASLAPLSPPIDLGSHPLGPSGVDASGTLWVALPALGQVIAVKDNVPAAPVKVAEPGHPLLLTIADGRPVVTDAADGVVMPLSADGTPERRINLPTTVAEAAPALIRVPERTEGPLLPVLASDAGQLVLLNLGDGAVQASPLATPKNDYGAPVVLGPRVYLPDRSSGELLVYDTAAAAFAPSVRVTGTSGPLEVGIRDGVLWANDQAQSQAVVVDLQGKVHEVDKYEPGVPSAEPSASTPPTGSPSGTPTPRPSDTPTPSDTATPPGEHTPGDDEGEPTPTRPTSPTRPAESPRDEPPTQEPPTKDAPVPVVTVTERVTVPPPPPRPVPPVTTPPPSPPKPPRTSAPPARPTQVKPSTTPPKAPAPPKPTAAPTTVVPSASVAPSASRTTAPTKPPATSPSAPPSTAPSAPAPKPPGTPKAESGPGSITLVFAASPGARPDRYTLDGLPVGAKAEPGAVTPNGPFQFVVTGLNCADEYSFKVVADFGHTKLPSGASTPVRPCVLVSAPTAVKAEVPRNGHGFTVSWNEPTNSGGSAVQYRVAWADTNGGNQGATTTTATTATVAGLANGVAYNVTVTAINAAGTGPAASTTASLVAPSRVYNVGPNTPNGVTVGIRSGPAVKGTKDVKQIPAGYEGPITVHCQTIGQEVPRDDTPLRGSIWDKVTWNGYDGYTSDLYIRTSNADQATFSPELWQCE